MDLHSSSRLIEGIGDEVLYTLVAVFTIGAFIVHLVARRRAQTRLVEFAPEPTPSAPSRSRDLGEPSNDSERSDPSNDQERPDGEVRSSREHDDVSYDEQDPDRSRPRRRKNHLASRDIEEHSSSRDRADRLNSQERSDRSKSREGSDRSKSREGSDRSKSREGSDRSKSRERSVPSSSQQQTEPDELLQEEDDNQENWPAGAISVTVKYLDDRRRTVYYLLEESVSEFKARTFRVVVANGRWVRLVHGGRELRDDLQMSSFHLPHSCILHCVLTDRRPEETPESGRERSSGEEEGFEPGAFLLPLLGIILGLVWLWVFVDSSAFRRSSVFILVAFTVLLGYAVIPTGRSQNSQQPQR